MELEEQEHKEGEKGREHFANSPREAAREVYQGQQRRQRSPWITQNTIELIDKQQRYNERGVPTGMGAQQGGEEIGQKGQEQLDQKRTRGSGREHRS